MNKTLIIAEAGVNHNGKKELAIELIAKAAECGADFIKFQTFIPEKLVSKTAQKAEYQKQSTYGDESQLNMLRSLQIPFDAYGKLIDTCSRYNIGFLSTPFDSESISFLDSLGMERWKIPSGEITNLPYLLQIAETSKPVILSTGMCTLNEVEWAVSILQKHGVSDITLLHCTTEYPTPFDEVNLNAMVTLRNKFLLPIGYSDHTLGIEIPIAAAALGACIIEKHFTLDRKMEGPDHKASLEPTEFKEMVKAIRNISAALGTGNKEPTPSELKNISVVRKSIVAKCRIAKGEVFTPDNITVKRPGNGISPMEWFNVLRKKAKRNFEEDELIEI